MLIASPLVRNTERPEYIMYEANQLRADRTPQAPLARVIFVLTLEADIRRREWHVRYVPSGLRGFSV